MVKAASQGALASVLVLLIIGYIRNGFEPAISIFLAEMIFTGMFLWIIAFGLFLVVLSPIIEVFKKNTRKVSVVVFVSVGLVLSTGLGYVVSIISSRGEAASYQVGDTVEAIITIVSFGMIGVIGTFFSWFSLKRDSDKVT
jgi:hypothetical protein